MMDSKQLALEMARLLSDKKAQDVQVLHIAHMTVIADYFVIASGRSTIQVRALSEELEKKMDSLESPVIRRDGVSESRWIVLDYGSVIVHVFHEQEREFYNIERLWTDGSNQIQFENA